MKSIISCDIGFSKGTCLPHTVATSTHSTVRIWLILKNMQKCTIVSQLITMLKIQTISSHHPPTNKMTVHTLSSSLMKQEAFEKCWAHSPLQAAARPNFTLPFTRCRYCHTPPLSHAACASTSTMTMTTTTTRDRGPLWPHGMGPIMQYTALAI